MLAGFLITFRETLEAALIVGIVVSFLSRIGQGGSKRSVWAGVGAGVAASIVGAWLFEALAGGFEGRSEAIFEGMTMLFGAGLLTTMILWMMRQSRVAEKLRSRVATELEKPHRVGLFLLVFVSVLREGIETVIFMKAARYTGGGAALAGGALGMVLAVVLGYAMFAASVRVNLKVFFRVTNVLLILFAAGLVAYGTHELVEARVLPPVIEEVWNVNPPANADGSYPWLHERGLIGGMLKTLFGWNGNPALLEVAAYGLYLGFVWWCWRRIAVGAERREVPAGERQTA